MKNIKSFTFQNTSDGVRVNINYSEIDENGEIIKSNERVSKIIVDESVLSTINGLNSEMLKMI